MTGKPCDTAISCLELDVARRQALRRLAIVLLLFSLGLVSWLSLSPSMAPPDAFDKILHTLAWCGILIIAASATLTSQASLWRISCLACAVFLASLALEFAQYFVPGRQPSLRDVFANLLGVLLGLVLVAVFAKLLSARAAARVRQS